MNYTMNWIAKRKHSLSSMQWVSALNLSVLYFWLPYILIICLNLNPFCSASFLDDGRLRIQRRCFKIDEFVGEYIGNCKAFPEQNQRLACVSGSIDAHRRAGARGRSKKLWFNIEITGFSGSLWTIQWTAQACSILYEHGTWCCYWYTKTSLCKH